VTEQTRVLVCGATGYLGGYVVKAAKARGYWVRALVRDASRFADGDVCDDVFVGQATQPETLRGMCKDVDVVFSSLGNRTLARKPDVFDVDYAANMNIVREARRAEVGQIVFVSVLRGAQLRKKVPQFEARERVVDALKAGGNPWTVIRPSGFFNDMSEIMEMARKGTAWIPDAGGTRFNPIHGADLAEVCVDAFGNDQAIGAEIPAGGPDVLSMVRVAELAFEALGKRPRIRKIPAWTLAAAATVIKPFNVNVASLLRMFTAFSGDAECDRYGDHHLADFFAELAARADEGGVAVRG
jgi:uncharacterized protein YbjT (DUF2867 family)